MHDTRSGEPALSVVWEGGMRYRAGRAGGGPTLLLDGEREAAPSPVEGMMAALAACSAIDVVEILDKRRTPPESLEVRVEYVRAGSPPRRVLEATLAFRVRTAAERHHVERAIQLSFEKYCSVSTTLDLADGLSWSLELEPAARAAE
jgi:putative redox protein